MSNTHTYKDFLGRISSYGDKTAIIDSQENLQYSYKELAKIISNLASVMGQKGIKAGDRLLLYGVRGMHWVPLFFAAQISGVIIVPIDSRASYELLQAMIKKTNPKLIVNEADMNIGIDIKTIRSFELIEEAERITKEENFKHILPDSIGQVLMTSGTWSDPKGVSLTQSNILENMNATHQFYKLDKKEILLSILPLSHAYEQMCGLHMPLHSGCTIVYLDDVTSDRITSAIKKHKVTTIIGVPRILDLFQKGILKKIPKAKLPFILQMNGALRYAPIWVRRKFFAKVHSRLGPALKTLVIGGAPLSIDVDKFFQGLGYKTLIGYGLSETSPIISVSLEQYGRKQGDVGKILNNIDFKINVENELQVKGPTVFKGYWPEAKTSEWFNTGDIASITDRKIQLQGRSKNLIVFANGDKITSEEVEHSIDSIEGIEESIVLSHDTEIGTSKGISIIYRSDNRLEEYFLRKHLNKFLPSSSRLISSTNIYPDKLERTHTLKLARKKIRNKFITEE